MDENKFQYIYIYIYATIRNVAGSRSDEVNEFFLIYLIHPAALGPEFYPVSNRIEYQKQGNNVSE
jgi:hypothetical protein